MCNMSSTNIKLNYSLILVTVNRVFLCYFPFSEISQSFQGVALITITTLAFIFNLYEVMVLVYKVTLRLNQNTFLLNIAVADLILSVSGFVRGCGMINPELVGYKISAPYNTTLYCKAYEMLNKAFA